MIINTFCFVDSAEVLGRAAPRAKHLSERLAVVSI